MSIENKKFTKLDVVSGKSYFLCQCGQSAKYHYATEATKTPLLVLRNMLRMQTLL